jgi:predicted alpha/beta hydrolase
MTERAETATAIPQEISALDGYPLRGTLFAPGQTGSVAHAVVFNCGGGIAASRYRHFAAWFATQGVPVLTYDYRGIAASRPSNLRALQATVEDWAEYDVGGAISHLRSLYPSAELVGISHSIGALLFGGAPNAQEIRRFVFVSPHTAYVGDYSARYRLPMALMWHYIMPALTHLVGYFPGKALRLGEDIPAGVALAWAGRRTPQLASTTQGVATSGAHTLSLLERARSIQGVILVVGFPDDVFATQRGVNRLLAIYPGLKPIHADNLFQPSGRKAGHFGFFRRGAESALWPSVLRWITGLT